MIEIIREENWDDTKEKKLPKDIRQIGRPDVGERIYIEDEVYRYLHPYESNCEKLVYVLLGRFENYSGRQCTFVEAAIQLEHLEFDAEIPRWSDHEWAYIYKRLKDEYDSMVIVGWALDHRGCLPNMTKQIEQFHQTHFGGVHQTLFLMDTLEKEETFFSIRNGHLYRREGFYIYYDRHTAAKLKKMEHREEKTEEINLPETDEVTFMQQDEPAPVQKEKENLDDILEEELYMEESMQQDEPEPLSQPELKRQGRYRKQLEEAEKTEEAKIPAYSSLVLAVVVLTLGFTAYQNHKKMNEMENTLAQMNQVHIVTEMPETEKTADSKIVVENIAGNIEKQTETKQADEHSTQTETEQSKANGTQAAEASAPDETAEVQADTEPSKTADTEEAAEPSGTAGAQKTMESQETESTQNREGEQKAETDTDETNSNKENVKETAAQPDEAQTYLKQGYYVVQQGDNLAAICRKIYQTTAMMDKVCEANGIDDPDAIYAGQYLTLPN